MTSSPRPAARSSRRSGWRRRPAWPTASGRSSNGGWRASISSRSADRRRPEQRGELLARRWPRPAADDPAAGIDIEHDRHAERPRRPLVQLDHRRPAVMPGHLGSQPVERYTAGRVGRHGVLHERPQRRDPIEPQITRSDAHGLARGPSSPRAREQQGTGPDASGQDDAGISHCPFRIPPSAAARYARPRPRSSGARPHPGRPGRAPAASRPSASRPRWRRRPADRPARPTRR